MRRTEQQLDALIELVKTGGHTMSHTISKGKASVTCANCQIVDVGGYDEDYHIAFCPLHAAAPALLAEVKHLITILLTPGSFHASNDYLEELQALITTAEGR